LQAEQTQRQRATQAAKEARTAQGRERTQFLRANAARQEAERQQQVAETQRRRAEQAAAISRRNLYFADMSLAPQDWKTHNIVHLRQLLDETRGSPERGFEWDFWQRLCQPERLTLRGHTSPVGAVAFSPDGSRVVTGGADRTARVWDARTGRQIL